MCICFGRVFKECRVIIIYVRTIVNFLAKNTNDSMGYTVNNNNRQGTSWVALFDPYSIQLDKTLDYYTLQLWIPLSNQTINSQGIPVVDGQ